MIGVDLRKWWKNFRWIALPITAGGMAAMLLGAVISLVAGLSLISTEAEYSSSLGGRIVNLPIILGAIKAGFFLVAGMILFAAGLLCRGRWRDKANT